MAWYFLRVPGCGARSAVASYKKEILKLGAVHECDLGTETDRTAGWYTVSVPLDTVNEVRERLRDLGLSAHVDQVEALVRPSEGRALSKQLTLF